MSTENSTSAAMPEQLTGRPKGWEKFVEGVIVIVIIAN